MVERLWDCEVSHMNFIVVQYYARNVAYIIILFENKVLREKNTWMSP